MHTDEMLGYEAYINNFMHVQEHPVHGSAVQTE